MPHEPFTPFLRPLAPARNAETDAMIAQYALRVQHNEDGWSAITPDGRVKATKKDTRFLAVSEVVGRLEGKLIS